MSDVSSKPFGVPWSWKQGLFVYVAAWIGLPVLLLFILRPLAPSFAEGLARGEVEAAFKFLVLDGLVALLLVRHLLTRHKAGWKDLGLRPFNLVKAGLYIFIAFWAFVIILAAAFGLLSWLFPGFNPAEPQVNEFTKGAATSPSLSLIALVVIPALFEEVVFRGFIFPAMADRFGLIAGVILSSLLFAVAHLQLNVGVYTFVLGCLLAIMYWKLRSIWPGIFLHLLNNYLAFTALVQK